MRCVSHAVLLGALVGAWVAGPSVAVATTHPTPREQAEELAREITDSWLRRQRADGSFRDYVADPGGGRRDRYGPAILAAGLLLEGVRTGRDDAVAAAFRSMRLVLASGPPRRLRVFDEMGVALAYGAARAHLAHDPRFVRLRPRWHAWMRSVQPYNLQTNPPRLAGRYYNWLLVEALGSLAAIESGVRSTKRGTVLSAPAATRRTIDHLMGHVLPAVGARNRTPSPLGPIAIVSDPPCNPPAYHALSIGLIAQLVGRTGAGPRARALLRSMARGSWALMAPDGDVAWFGRSQQEAWTLSMTAAGVLAAAAQPDVPAGEAQRLSTVASRALTRLRTHYAAPSVGVWITPGFGVDRLAAIRGVDPYTAAASYTGLTLLGLQWVIGEPAATRPAPPTGLFSDGAGVLRLGRTGDFAVARHGDTWMSVKRCPAQADLGKVDYTHDMRYDPGVTAVQVREPGGGWRAVQPSRPRTHVWDGAGPVLELRGRRARMVGGGMRFRRGGVVTLPVAFRTHAGEKVRTAAVTYRPIRCGVRVSVPARAGDLWEYSGFFARRPRRVARGVVSDGTQRLRVDGATQVRMRPGYASATHPRLVRVRLRVRVRSARTLRITICRPGALTAALSDQM